MDVIVEGIDGSGKTTFCGMLCKELLRIKQERKLDIPIGLIKRDFSMDLAIERLENLATRKKDSVSNTNKLNTALALLHFSKFIKLYTSKEYKIGIWDRSIYSTIAYYKQSYNILSILNNMECFTLHNYFHRFSHLFYLNCPVDLAMERLHMKGEKGYYEEMNMLVNAKRRYDNLFIQGEVTQMSNTSIVPRHIFVIDIDKNFTLEDMNKLAVEKAHNLINYYNNINITGTALDNLFDGYEE